MSKVQRSPLAPPSEDELKTLLDYTAKIQDSFDDLYLDSHEHNIKEEDPDDTEGEIGDIALISTSSAKYLAIKFSDGWYKTSNLTKI